ncbi:MAG: 2-amino-4-hydroxy-6-hydroxymethyldihydropteridine diphosphokinase [Kiritimatiellae bacterium]|nr:2-amino-4-hydroxy-6-hydroxymethyldihydropteridine diphosphokinase [Kiritimatiellia bacterium]MDD5523076.1 2-amino-4-hydroxy-6-hydroxymethyldihydropteridine diphosphokinase [Kiritimatiellia bacterium]
MEIGLSLGSNLGDRLNNLKQARDKISTIQDVDVIDSSPVYETEPVDVLPGYAGLPFLNAVLIINSDLDADDLLNKLLSIEKTMGRELTSGRNSPRPIDIDIIFAGDRVIKRENGGIPHPRWSQRRFVVQPLADIRPDLHIPGETRTVAEVLLTLPLTPKVVLFLQRW